MSNQNYSIYKITNKITQKIYIGMTKRTLERRFKSHLYEAKVKKYNMYLHNSIRKHGSEAFIINLIETGLDYDNAALKEQKYIKELNTLQPYGYNEHIGGKGGCKDATPELRQKLSKARLGKSPWNKGRKTVKVKKKLGPKLGNIPWNKGRTLKQLVCKNCFKVYYLSIPGTSPSFCSKKCYKS